MPHDVATSMYLSDKDPLWNSVKPYGLKFQAPQGFPKSNAEPRKCDGIMVEDIRGREHEFCIDAKPLTPSCLHKETAILNFKAVVTECPAPNHRPKLI